MATKLADRIAGRLPEWPEFVAAVRGRHPHDGTHCEAWTVRDIVAHNAGNAEELARILTAHLSGDAVPDTRSFEEREARYRELPDPDLLSELEHRVQQLANVLDVAADTDQEAAVPWTGRTMKVAWFGEHMRRMDLAPPAGRAVVESDPAARLLLLWGRRPAEPGAAVQRCRPGAPRSRPPPALRVLAGASRRSRGLGRARALDGAPGPTPSLAKSRAGTHRPGGRAGPAAT